MTADERQFDIFVSLFAKNKLSPRSVGGLPKSTDRHVQSILSVTEVRLSVPTWPIRSRTTRTM